MTVKGLNDTLKNLNKEIKNIKGKSAGGLLAAALLLQRESDKKAPHEYGFLKASSYARKALDGSIAAETGYNSEYAAAVHEKVEEKLRGQKRPSGLGVYWGKGESQFLLKAMLENKKQLLVEIAKRAKIK